MDVNIFILWFQENFLQIITAIGVFTPCLIYLIKMRYARKRRFYSDLLCYVFAPLLEDVSRFKSFSVAGGEWRWIDGAYLPERTTKIGERPFKYEGKEEDIKFFEEFRSHYQSFAKTIDEINNKIQRADDLSIELAQKIQNNEYRNRYANLATPFVGAHQSYKYTAYLAERIYNVLLTGKREEFSLRADGKFLEFLTEHGWRALEEAMKSENLTQLAGDASALAKEIINDSEKFEGALIDEVYKLRRKYDLPRVRYSEF